MLPSVVEPGVYALHIIVMFGLELLLEKFIVPTSALMAVEVEPVNSI